jgi:hypothetical protein
MRYHDFEPEKGSCTQQWVLRSLLSCDQVVTLRLAPSQKAGRGSGLKRKARRGLEVGCSNRGVHQTTTESEEGRTVPAAPTNPVLMPAGHLASGLCERDRGPSNRSYRSVGRRGIDAALIERDDRRNALHAASVVVITARSAPGRYREIFEPAVVVSQPTSKPTPTTGAI